MNRLSNRGDRHSFQERLGRAAAGLLVGLGVLAGVAGSAVAGPGIEDEPDLHRSYTRDLNGKITTISRGKKLNYAADLKNTKFGAIDGVFAQCFGGGYLSGFMAENLPDYSFASASGWNQTAFSSDEGKYFYDPAGVVVANKDPRLVDNWTRAWRESAHRIPNGGMKDHYTVTINGNLIPKIEQDLFTTKFSSKENPQYGSTGAAADARKIKDAAKDGGKRYAVIVDWDKTDPSDRHGVNISRMYQTLTTVHNIPQSNIVVLHPQGANALLGPYINNNVANGMQSPVLPSWGGEPINFAPVTVDAGNTRKDWEDALAGRLFTNADGTKGVEISDKDSLLVYNTGHGGHTGIIEKGELGLKDGDDKPISVRYEIPDTDVFFRSVLAGGSDGPKNAVPSYAPDEVFKMQLSFDKALDLSKVKIRIDGGAMKNLSDGTNFAEVDLDPLVEGKLQHWRFDKNEIKERLLAGRTVIDLYDVPANILKDLGGRLMTAAVLNGGDQEAVCIVVPAPGVGALGVIGMTILARRRRRGA